MNVEQQEDWVNHQLMLIYSLNQLEVAKVDPNFFGIVKQDRINHYEKEVEKWRALCQ